MENVPASSPINPHFFQPLLPGFQSHLNIPTAFFTRYVEGKTNKGNAVVKLISNASDTTWEVKMEGRRLTQGWQKFATSHDLRVGDIVVFRHDGDFLFHVTSFGRSCCEIQYDDDDVIQISSDSDSDSDSENIQYRTGTTPGLQLRSPCMKSQYRFLTLTLKPYNLNKCILFLPGTFVRANGIEQASKITLVDRYGIERTTTLKPNDKYGRMRLGKGWREFCDANGVKSGDSFKLELVKGKEDTATHLLKFCSKVLNPL